MSKTLTTNELDWDARPFSLTLAGCLTLAGMPLPETGEAAADLYAMHTDNADPIAETAPTIKFDSADDAPIREAFHITDTDSANWYLRKLASIEAEKKRIQAQSELMLRELDTDRDGLKFLYEGELQEFVRQELAKKGGKKKTLHLLQGTCAFRTVPASVKVADAFAALTYAKANGLPCIVTQERIDAEEYKKIAEGKLLPGMDTTPARESFDVKFGA